MNPVLGIPDRVGRPRPPWRVKRAPLGCSWAFPHDWRIRWRELGKSAVGCGDLDCLNARERRPRFGDCAPYAVDRRTNPGWTESRPMNSVSPRPAVGSDASELARLTSQLGYPVEVVAMERRLQRILAHDGSRLLVVEGGGGRLSGWIHGYASQLLESDFRVEIGGLIVDESDRRSGIGRQLVAAIERWAVELGAAELGVRCREERSEAHRFYESLGLVRTKTQRVFRKRLKD